MIRLEDFGDFVSLATIEYKDRLFSKMNYIDMIDDNSIEILFPIMILLSGRLYICPLPK